MSIASELTALAANKAAIKAAIEAKNPTVAPTDALSQWPTSIASIGGGGHEGWIYGYVIDESNSDPATRVTYIEDNAAFSPLYMDFANDTLVWGSWQSFVEEYFRPAMLKSDGTIDYYLDPYDLTKKADGVTASDVANTSYDGNAMLIVKPIYYNIGRVGPTQIRVRFSNYKQGGDWFNWTHLKSDGTYAEFCGWPLFEGSIVSDKLRSLKGLQLNATGRTLSQQYNIATANGSNWYPTTFADEMMIRLLFPLFCKTTNSVSSIGNSLEVLQQTGILSGSGYFYGTNSSSSALQGQKFIGMENIWGSLWRQCVGAVNRGPSLSVKLTPSMIDGTTVSGFRSGTAWSDYDGYLLIPFPANTTNGCDIQLMDSNPFSAFIPTKATTDTSSFSNYYCDYFWWTRTDSSIFGIVFGGEYGLSNGSSGIFACGGNLSPDNQFSKYSASLSYHFF